MNKQTRCCRRRDGIALLIVLGMLALLMITAVAFTIMMRMERSGASNLRHATGARQMMEAAVSRAMADIHVDVGNSRYPAWTNRSWTLTGTDDKITRKVSFGNEILHSVDEAIGNSNNVNPARVLSVEAMKYVPGAFHQAVETAKPEWIPVVADGKTVGRFAYVVLNTSGLLDANLVHGTNRWVGSLPDEIQVDKAVQKDVVDATAFAAQRKTDGSYQTLPEFRARNAAVDHSKLANFEVFSHAYEESLPDDAPGALKNLTKGRKIQIGGSAASIRSQRSAIEQAFGACGLNSEQSKWAYLGLVDYADADSEPEGGNDAERFGRPATEAAPLFCAYHLLVRYDRVDNGTTYTHEMTYQFEVVFAYPFVLPGTGFTIAADLVRYDVGTEDVWDPLLLPDEMISLSDSGNCAFGDYLQLQSAPIVRTVTVDKAQGSNPNLIFETYCRTRSSKGGKVIRQTPIVWDFDPEMPTLKIDMETTPMAVAEERSYWTETIDPRFNWNGEEVKYWRDNQDPAASGAAEAPLNELASMAAFAGYSPAYDGASIGSLATFMLTSPRALSDYFKIVVDGGRDGAPKAQWDPLVRQTRFHVANAPLKSAGELGYLPIERWLTITLYDHGHASSYGMLPASGYHPVLDYFTTRSVDLPLKGRVNMSTRQEAALAAVFQQMPVRSETVASPAPIPAVGADAEFDDALDLARQLKAKGPFARLSQLGRIWQGADQLGVQQNGNDPTSPTSPVRVLSEACGAAGFGEFEREAVIRNACNLLTTRQQTYTIILRADSFSTRFGLTSVREGTVLATAHAVVQIWRDPELQEGKHRCFVQLLKPISD